VQVCLFKAISTSPSGVKRAYLSCPSCDGECSMNFVNREGKGRTSRSYVLSRERGGKVYGLLLTRMAIMETNK